MPSRRPPCASGRLGPEHCEILLTCGHADVRVALDQLVAHLCAWGFAAEGRAAAQLILAEIVNNISEHAYDGRRPAGPIAIRCAREPAGIALRITDQGKSMPSEEVPAGRARSPAALVRDLPEGGFGWFLIRALASDIRYARSGVENHLDLRIAMARG